MTEQDPWEAAQTYTWEQDMRRGSWPTPRTAKMPDPPWPSPDNPMLAALLHDASKNFAGLGVDAAMIQLATCCWFEGGIEGYDRGQSDAQGIGGAADERSRGFDPVPSIGRMGPVLVDARRVS